MNKELKELLNDNWDADIKPIFAKWKQQELQKVGSLSEKELTTLQERVNILTEVENRLLTLIQQ
jgi:hypothetical protein